MKIIVGAERIFTTQRFHFQSSNPCYKKKRYNRGKWRDTKHNWENTQSNTEQHSSSPTLHFHIITLKDLRAKWFYTLFRGVFFFHLSSILQLLYWELQNRKVSWGNMEVSKYNCKFIAYNPFLNKKYSEKRYSFNLTKIPLILLHTTTSIQP